MSLTLQFVPYDQVKELDSPKRIKKLLSIVKKNKIVLLEGRLTPAEEALLIKTTMESIDKKFEGIEFSVVYPESQGDEWLMKIRNRIVNMLLGNRSGFTIIGPANVVKEIRQDPDKIQLLTQ